MNSHDLSSCWKLLLPGMVLLVGIHIDTGNGVGWGAYLIEMLVLAVVYGLA
jgi:hypothetical protein